MTLRTGGLQYYPQTIKKFEERIAAYEKDAALAERHKPQGVDFDGTLVSPKHSSQRLRLLSANTWRLSSSSNPQSTAHRIMLNTSASLYLMYPECRGSFITIGFGTVSSIFITLPSLHHILLVTGIFMRRTCFLHSREMEKIILKCYNLNNNTLFREQESAV